MNVLHHTKITEHCIFRDAEQLYSGSDHFLQFSENAYRHFNIEYPKFHKMDKLCKLGFLAAEILLKNVDLTGKYENDRIAVILANSSSSLDTDLRYQELMKKAVPSPAVFVYSLPNIVIGEICIRFGIKGENTFFISEEYDIPSQFQYVNQLLETSVADSCIAGWVELTGEKYEAFLYLVTKEKEIGKLPFTEENIRKLYANT